VTTRYDNRGIKRTPTLWSPVNDHDSYPYETDTPMVDDDINTVMPADPMKYASASDSSSNDNKGSKAPKEK
jgi:hypothetical protein